MEYGQKSLQSRKNGSPLFLGISAELNDLHDLSTYYSPGIAEPCRQIAADKKLAKKYTVQKNTVAVISDGSAVLGLGNIGADAALPVMEGKCMLLKKFANVDGVPIVLNTQDTDEIVETIIRMAPSFGGINIEDIAAPRCFEIEKRVAERLDIPVFHDDQHGTAMVVLAGLKNALKVVKKDKENIRVVISGAGAGGIAIGKILKHWGIQDLLMIDSKGVLTDSRNDLNTEKVKFSRNFSGTTLADAVVDADVFIGVSKAGLLKTEMVKTMKNKSIIFALANPVPEITPEDAKKGGASIIATGRSDYLNQINNVLIFPGFFRGLLDYGIIDIKYDMKIKAALALANLVPNPTEDFIIPSPFDPAVSHTVANSLKTS